MNGNGDRPRVLITGGAGFLGSHLADRLLQAGYQVRLLDALDPQVHPHGAPSYLHPDAELQIGNVLDPRAVERALIGVTAVVHFAAVVGVGQSLYQIARYNEVNLQGTAVLLEAMLRRQRQAGQGFSRLLVAGSMSVYGEGRYGCPGCGGQPDVAGRTLSALRQQQWEPRCDACHSPLEPLPTDEGKRPQLGSIYALTKYMQEEMCLLFGRTYELPTVALRFFNAYGPRQALSNPYTGVAAVFAAELLAGRAPRIFEDGAQLRDLVSVHDVAAACQLALERPEAIGKVLNVASGKTLSVERLARSIAEALGVALEPHVTGRFRVGDARHCVADISAARRLLGFSPAVTLAAGMGELAEWLQDQPNAPAGPTAGRRPLTQEHATAELRAFGLTG